MLDMANSDLDAFGILIFLLIGFLIIPQITGFLKESLDTLPIRLASVILILASIYYDKYVALGVLMVISAIYIHHHHEDIMKISGSRYDMNSRNYLSGAGGNTLAKLDQGGYASETIDVDEFISKAEDQNNDFTPVDSSMNEKHSLVSEYLGSKSQALFSEDSSHVNAMEHTNKNGYSG